jgi:hypothetical protein
MYGEDVPYLLSHFVTHTHTHIYIHTHTHLSLSIIYIYIYIYVAYSPDAKTVMVDTGVGVHVEFELTEAVAFIDKRVGVLEAKANALNTKAAGIKSHMKLVRQGMQELAETVSADVKARQSQSR